MPDGQSIAVGVDIGGTNTALGLVRQDGHCLVECSFRTNSHEPPETFAARLHEKIEELRVSSHVQVELKGIGIGAPNGNHNRGTIENAPNLGWKGVVDLVSLLKQYYDVPVALTNDANAAALGEMKFGGAKEMKNFIVVTLGTGLGSGIVVDGNVLYGSTGFAGELGHIIVDPAGRECGCGRRGCLETYASATAICRTVWDLLSTRTDKSELRSKDPETITSQMIAEAAQRGDKLALEAFEYTGRILGAKLADAVAITSPEAIFFFGGLVMAGELILEPTRRHLEMNLLNIFKGTVKLLPSQMAQSAAVIGASALVWQ